MIPATPIRRCFVKMSLRASNWFMLIRRPPWPNRSAHDEELENTCNMFRDTDATGCSESLSFPPESWTFPDVSLNAQARCLLLRNVGCGPSAAQRQIEMKKTTRRRIGIRLRPLQQFRVPFPAETHIARFQEPLFAPRSHSTLNPKPETRVVALHCAAQISH